VDHIYGRAGSDRLKGFSEFDELYGQHGGDRLFGGFEKDSLTAGAGKDTLSGGGGGDWYYFGDGWGKDSITDDAASANRLLFRNAPSSSVFITDDLVIDLDSGPGPEVTNTSGTNIVNWEGNDISDVSSGGGDDQITGNTLGNQLSGYTGADTIFGMGGNDEIDVMDETPDDTVDCGEDLIGGADNKSHQPSLRETSTQWRSCTGTGLEFVPDSGPIPAVVRRSLVRYTSGVRSSISTLPE